MSFFFILLLFNFFFVFVYVCVVVWGPDEEDTPCETTTKSTTTSTTTISTTTSLTETDEFENWTEIAEMTTGSDHDITSNGSWDPWDPDNCLRVLPSGYFQCRFMQTRKGKPIRAFLGIRYAVAPIGSMRFKPSKLFESYESLVDAQHERSPCPTERSFNHVWWFDEDCLFINVYEPLLLSSKPLPVIVYIHHGNFLDGSGNHYDAGPYYIMDQNVVFVTFNYRLGILGFLSTGDKLAPGNNGLKDQVVALQWVRKYIQYFQGDKNMVTIVGGSGSGGISAMLHMISPMSKGLFHHAVSMSGSPIGIKPVPDNLYDLAVKQAKLLDCPYENSKVIINCLRDLPLFAFLDMHIDWEFARDLQWVVVEKDFGQERFLHLQPDYAIKKKKLITPVPFIIGMTTHETFPDAFYVLNKPPVVHEMNEDWENSIKIALQLPENNIKYAAAVLRSKYLGNQSLSRNKDSAKRLGNLYADASAFLIHRMANLMCRHSPYSVWYYQFNYQGSQSFFDVYENYANLKGVARGDDLIYGLTMDRFSFISNDPTKPDSKVLEVLTKGLYDFALQGNPNSADSSSSESDDEQWRPMTPKERAYIRVSTRVETHYKMFEDKLKLWEDLYPMVFT